MAKIAPFNAFIYNQDKLKDLSKVVCPPYDVISTVQQHSFLDSSPYNFIHILLGKDVPGDDKYQKAGRYFKDWINEKILVRDEKPAVYFYKQEYNLKGEKRQRLGFIALLRLEEKNSCVFGHEHTRLEPKEDRLMLLRQVKANLSPIFAIFSDQHRIIQQTYQKHIQNKKPFIDVVDNENITHKVWRLDSPDIVTGIQHKMKDEVIFIADGHHRYEVACTYREEINKKSGGLTGEEGINYILAYFTNTDLRGLTIMPIHRLVKLDLGFDLDKFKTSVSEHFDIEQIKDKTKFFFLMQKAGSAEHVIGMYREKKFWLLRLKNIRILDKIIADKQKEYRSLDVSILNYMILNRALGLDIENKERIVFNHNPDELIEQVDKQNRAIAFFLNPAKTQQIMSIALTGEKMPSKSTYFYPKVLSGLVINKLE